MTAMTDRTQDDIDDIRTVAAQREAEQKRAEERAAKTWSTVPPTVNGLYWFRTTPGKVPSIQTVYEGCVCMSSARIMLGFFQGEWLPVVMPGPENEPGVSDVH